MVAIVQVSVVSVHDASGGAEEQEDAAD